jgi:hypothetical protein
MNVALTLSGTSEPRRRRLHSASDHRPLTISPRFWICVSYENCLCGSRRLRRPQSGLSTSPIPILALWWRRNWTRSSLKSPLASSRRNGRQRGQAPLTIPASPTRPPTPTAQPLSPQADRPADGHAWSHDSADNGPTEPRRRQTAGRPRVWRGELSRIATFRQPPGNGIPASHPT